MTAQAPSANFVRATIDQHDEVATAPSPLIARPDAPARLPQTEVALGHAGL